MKQFLELNRHKLQFAFTFTATILTTAVIIVFTVSYFKDAFPAPRLLLSVLFVSAILLPVFIISLAYLTWYHRSIVRRQSFSNSPFDQLDKIGFSKSLINEHSKWFFTEEIKVASINGHTFYCDISRDKSHVIAFRTSVTWNNPEGKKFQQVSSKLKAAGLEMDIDQLSKNYDIKKASTKNIYDIKNDLEEFAVLIKQEGFNCKPNGIAFD